MTDSTVCALLYCNLHLCGSWSPQRQLLEAPQPAPRFGPMFRWNPQAPIGAREIRGVAFAAVRGGRLVVERSQFANAGPWQARVFRGAWLKGGSDPLPLLQSRSDLRLSLEEIARSSAGFRGRPTAAEITLENRFVAYVHPSESSKELARALHGSNRVALVADSEEAISATLSAALATIPQTARVQMSLSTLESDAHSGFQFIGIVPEHWAGGDPAELGYEVLGDSSRITAVGKVLHPGGWTRAEGVKQSPYASLRHSQGSPVPPPRPRAKSGLGPGTSTGLVHVCPACGRHALSEHRLRAVAGRERRLRRRRQSPTQRALERIRGYHCLECGATPAGPVARTVIVAGPRTSGKSSIVSMFTGLPQVASGNLIVPIPRGYVSAGQPVSELRYWISGAAGRAVAVQTHEDPDRVADRSFRLRSHGQAAAVVVCVDPSQLPGVPVGTGPRPGTMAETLCLLRALRQVGVADSDLLIVLTKADVIPGLGSGAKPRQTLADLGAGSILRAAGSARFGFSRHRTATDSLPTDADVIIGNWIEEETL